MILDEAELERFMLSTCPEPNTGCWLWMKSTPKNGYAQFRVDGVQATAHAVSYWNFKGPVQPGFMVHHKCRVRCCVNPEHLDALSAAAHRSTHAGQRLRPLGPEMKPADQIIIKFGGISALANALGHKHSSTVQGWQNRGSIPPRRQPEVLRAARSKNIKLHPKDFLSPELYEIANCTDGIRLAPRVRDKGRAA